MYRQVDKKSMQETVCWTYYCPFLIIVFTLSALLLNRCHICQCSLCFRFKIAACCTFLP